LFGSSLTPARPKLGFARTLGLVAVAMDERESKKKSSESDSWLTLLNPFKKYKM
jgi:hypothetical protein